VLARALDGQRYEVLFACGERYRTLVAEAGIPWYPIPTMPAEEFAQRLAVGRPIFTLERLREYTRAEQELFARVSPDLVVGDFRVSLGISAAAARIPYVALTNAHWSPFSTRRFPLPEHPAVRLLGVRMAQAVVPRLLPVILRFHVRAFNRLRHERGLSPVAGLREMYTLGTWTLYLDTPTLSPTRDLPSNHRYLGPILWEPELPLPTWWDTIRTHESLVYVTLGSSGDSRGLSTILEALEGMPVVAAVATAGHRLESVPNNVFAADYLPGLRILDRARLVVSNGGSGTSYQAISRGVPILGLPFNADQYFTMEGLASEGAGILIRSGRATARDVRRAMERLLAEPGYRVAAAHLRSELSRYAAEREFALFIESVAAGLAPTGRSGRGNLTFPIDTLDWS
jgi:UDP:flavonoid glycosyltransferase YjiC (YdhE family)